MQVRSQKSVDHTRLQPVAPCAQCGKMLLRPEWSEYLNTRQVRHLWMCRSCGYDFETLVVFPAVTAEPDNKDTAKST